MRKTSIAIAILAASLSPGSSSAVDKGATCSVHHIRVAIAPGLPGTESIYAELCLPARRTPTVHLLVTPAAANHKYWDPTYQPERYSNVRALNRAGYATLNIDAVGSGASSHPLSPLVTIDSYVYQVHQLIDLLRSGRIDGHAFSRVVTHGLSNGSLVAVIEAARYHDVDGIILTGFTFLLRPEALLESATVTQSALQQQRYANRHLDPGYIAFSDRFYEHTMISAHDYDLSSEVHLKEYRDTLTGPYATATAVYLYGLIAEPTDLLSPTRSIEAPMLVAVGSEDFTMCGPPPFGTDCTNAATVRAKVAPFYPSARSLDTFVLPRSGHVMNLALNAPDWFAYEIDWINREIG